ncbi:hypothetical protein [Glycomyces albidus]|jgi:hypothetical protein|nr:hypothetical protein [Glycomyces albidus]
MDREPGPTIADLAAETPPGGERREAVRGLRRTVAAVPLESEAPQAG